jgi:hypothetical protein
MGGYSRLIEYDHGVRVCERTPYHYYLLARNRALSAALTHQSAYKKSPCAVRRFFEPANGLRQLAAKCRQTDAA